VKTDGFYIMFGFSALVIFTQGGWPVLGTEERERSCRAKGTIEQSGK